MRCTCTFDRAFCASNAHLRALKIIPRIVRKILIWGIQLRALPAPVFKPDIGLSTGSYARTQAKLILERARRGRRASKPAAARLRPLGWEKCLPLSLPPRGHAERPRRDRAERLLCSRGQDIDGMVPAAYMVGAWRRHRLHSAGDGAAGPVRDRTPALAIMVNCFFFCLERLGPKPRRSHALMSIAMKRLKA